MRWFTLLLVCGVLATTLADPDPKKYKNESEEKSKKTEALTDDEKKFLKEVEEKFGVKSDVPVENKEEETKVKADNIDKEAASPQQKPSFPAVIAIEIVNDTETVSKDKRTIDANLGYGYRTNNGYTYTYFGKSNQDKGKFMIYPYSQEDIPPKQYNNQGYQYNVPSGEKHSSSQVSSVEIQPSQAYELVPLKNEQPSYQYNKPSVEFNYEKKLNTPTSYSGKSAQTLYTTYNGQEFSGLSGQFPTVMPNYFVDASQLLKNPHYLNAGLTQDHLRTQNSYLNQNQRIVPVLVLRVPSSYLKNPTAELYPNLPQNYPLSQHLNSVNLQQLVNQYFKKNGLSFAPQIMSYQNPTVPSLAAEPQYYSNPYVKPTYTQADYSGIQYSAVKPVMARYPLTYTQQKYLLSQPQSLNQRPAEPQYEYEYKYVPQTEVKMQTYYIQPQYQQSSQSGAPTSEYQNEQSVEQQQSSEEDTSSSAEYGAPQYSNSQQGQEAAVEYEQQSSPQVTAQPDLSQYVSANPEAANYNVNKGNVAYSNQAISSGYESASIPSYNSQSSEYYSSKSQTNAVSVLPSKLIHTEQYEESEAPNAVQDYTYQSRANEDSGKSFVISENYPSKDHTIATVLPYSYKSSKNPVSSGIQTVSYVTPMPSARYQSQYKIMVPQTVLRHPSSEKVSYVNSQSVPHYTQNSQYNSANSDNYYSASQYTALLGNKPSYTRNYHPHPKRMARPDNKQEGSSKVTTRKHNERKESKKSS